MKKSENILKIFICVGLVAIGIWAICTSIQSMFDTDFTFFRKIGLLGMALVINGMVLAMCNSIYQDYKEG